MNERENRMRAYRFEGPDWVPVTASIPPTAWAHYDPDALEDLMLGHSILFPGYERNSVHPDHIRIPPDMHAGRPYIDGWGCVWETACTGMVGSVRTHPLDDWTQLESLRPPDPDRHNGMYSVDWAQLAGDVGQARQNGAFVILWLPHGHTFLRLQDLRGYVNLLQDMAEEDPCLSQLIEMVQAFNSAVIERFVRLEPDMIGLPEDLGMQHAPLLSPSMFRRYIKPCYVAMARPIRARGILVHRHSDGFILDLVDDILESGCDVLNLQDLVNGIDTIRASIKDRVAIDLDVDRQFVTHCGSPQDVDDLIREEVEKLSSPEGGLSLSYQPWPPAPLENIRAAFDAMEKYSGCYD